MSRKNIINIPSRLIQAAFRLFRFKEQISRQFRDPPRDTGVLRQEKFPGRLSPTVWEVEGFPVLTLHSERNGNGHVFFLPGGAYLLEATPFHGKFACLLADVLDFSVSIFEYPRAPEYNYQTTIQVTLEAYLALVERFPGQEYILVGDSAGGGLGLALLQNLRDRGIQERPRKSVLISPWVDLSLSNPAIRDYIYRDSFLPLEGLMYAARLYSAGEDLKHPNLSPLYGKLFGLGSILLFCGTHDLLYPDCQALASKLSKLPGTVVKTIFREGQFHDWVIFPLPESREAVMMISNFLRTDGPQDR